MIELTDKRYSVDDIAFILSSGDHISLGNDLVENILSGRNFLENYLKNASNPVYGINTGFGSLCDTQISAGELELLQQNLVMSHAAGVGNAVDREIVRCMLLLKIIGLSKGNSGVTLDTVQRLVDFYNSNIIPVVYEQGSLGASGDLAPLAHLSLPLIGMGEVWYNGNKIPAEQALKEAGMQPLTLKSKEGLALLNGTQFMLAHAAYIYSGIGNFAKLTDLIAALSIEAFRAKTEPFHPGVHSLRPHSGQVVTAERILQLLAGSQIEELENPPVQDPYSFRCIPQVHGASKDAIDFVGKTIDIEINSVTDNPTLLPDQNSIVSAGNFHGQPIAIGFDILCIALAELASISERRIYKFMGGSRQLPHYLCANPGLNSGFMIAQYAAASLVSQNKQLCTPASVDTIDSSNGQEDHVSMGANAALKALKVYQNTKTVYAIELLVAAQAADFRSGKSAPATAWLRQTFRNRVPFIERDCIVHELIKSSTGFVDELVSGKLAFP